MSDSARPYRQQPIRLPRPWDSPGKNTGVGCHFLLQCMKVKSKSEVAQSCPTLHDPMDCSLSGSSVHGIFQARALEWVAIAFSDDAKTVAKWFVQFIAKEKQKHLSCWASDIYERINFPLKRNDGRRRKLNLGARSDNS